jgi:phosphoserine phosphatase RsbU/P
VVVRRLPRRILTREHPPGAAAPQEVEHRVCYAPGGLLRRSAAPLGRSKQWLEWLLRREREISLTLQRALLPPSLPEIPGLRVAARYVAASEGMEVGGDLYDVFPFAPERWAMVVGDVTGKGPEAASLTSLAHYTIRAASASEPGPIEVVQRLNEEIVRQTEGLNLMTLMFGELWREGEGWRLELATGGHPPPLVLRAVGAAELHEPGGMLLGASEEPALGGWSLYLSAGDAIVLYTDGVTEARSPTGEFFGDERLAELGERCARLSAEEIAESITSEVRGFQNGSPRDDMAVLVLEAVQ